MATTNISTEIVSITGLAAHAASDDFIVSAQKFVVASVPKNLLKFAQTASSASTDGSAISYTRNDSIIDVQRNGYSCREIPFSESVWASDSGSLKKATNSFPVYWQQNDGVKIAPATSSSSGAGYIFYVASSKLDDDCDLRSAVIYKAASSEFMKLASDQTSGIDTALPLLKAAVDQAEAAANKFESATESVFGDEDTFDTAASQLTRVKDALNNAESLIDNNLPAASYDAYDLLQDEDTELLQGNLAIVGAEIQRAQAHLSEWTSIGDMRVKEVDVAIKEANGYAQEVQTRINNKTIYMQSADKYYQWAQMEVQQYVQNNEKTFAKGVAAQSASQQQQASR